MTTRALITPLITRLNAVHPYFGGVELHLHPEPDNPFDANAIAVRTSSGTHIGYIPATTKTSLGHPINTDILPILAGTSTWRASLTFLPTGQLAVKLTWDDEEEAKEANALQPNPGSDEAIKSGCLCPILDNNHGQGFGDPQLFYINEECPLHSPNTQL